MNLSAYAMAERTDGLAIGMGPRESARMLRRLARALDAGKIIPRRATVQSVADEAEFTSSALIFEFYEKLAPEAPKEPAP